MRNALPFTENGPPDRRPGVKRQNKTIPPRFQKTSLKESILIKKTGKLAVQPAKHTCRLGKTAPTNASRQISAKPESGAKENAFKDFDKKTQTG